MLHLLILKDGKPGHYKKSEAVAQAMTAQRPATISRLDVRMRFAAYHDALRFYLKQHRTLPGLNWLRMVYRLPAELPHRPDLIISSGGKTAFINAWLAQHYRCANVFIGFSRGISDAYFSRLIVHNSEHAGDPRFIDAPIPTEITPAILNQAETDYLTGKPAGFTGTSHWTLLVGGRSGGYRYSRRDWTALAESLPILAARFNIRWLITTSRRTDRTCEQLLSCPEVKACVDELQIVRTDPRRIYNALLGRGRVIFCTEDSGTMLTEAAATGKPVIALRPKRARATLALDQLLDYYVSRSQMQRVPIEDMIRLDAGTLTACAVPSANESLSQVAEQLQDVLPAAA